MENDVENNSGTDNYQRQILANNKEKSFSNEHDMQHRHHHHHYRHRYHIHISSMTPNATIMDPLRASLHALSHDQLLLSRQSLVQTTKPYQSMKILFLLLFLHLTIQNYFPMKRQPLAHVYNISVDQQR